MHTLTELQSLFDFTDEDLAANRAGKLSDSQRERFRRELHHATVERAAAGLVVPILPICICGFIFFSLNYGDALGPLVLVAIVVWLALMWVLLRVGHRLISGWLSSSATSPDHWALRRLGGSSADRERAIAQGKVIRAAGKLTYPTDGEHTYVMLDEVEFTTDVSAEQDERLWKLTEGQRYAFYYVPETLWIASVEPLA